MKPVNIFYRLFILPFICFFKVLGSGSFASQVVALSENSPELPTEDSTEPESDLSTEPEPEPEPEPMADPAKPHVQVLALLQKEGRLVDFLQQDISSFSNEDVGQAARVVHEGCAKVLKNYFALEPIHEQSEGAQVTIAEGYTPAHIRLSGNVQGNPPFQGELLHHGWKVTDSNLPEITDEHAHEVIAPAEVEVS